MSRVRVLRAATALGLAVLLGGLTLPLLGLALAGEPASFCCSKGRCCCADETAGTDSRACLRQRCGCGQLGAAVIAAPLHVEAVLPAAGFPATVPASEARRETAAEQPLPRADPPPVPPP